MARETGLGLSHLNHAIGVYIIKDKVFVYHQFRKELHIIKPTKNTR